MNDQPLIIQIIARNIDSRMRRQAATLALFGLAATSVGSILLIREGSDSRSVLITAAMILVLVANLVLMFYRNRMDHYSKSLFLASDNCYTVAGHDQVRECVPLRLEHGQDAIIIDPHQRGRGQQFFAERITSFRILDHTDWERLKEQASPWTVGHDNTHTTNVSTILSKTVAV